MSQNALRKIENFDAKELKHFLRSNGMGVYLRIFDLEKIDGKTFLNLSKADFLRWKKTIPTPELEALKKIWKDIRETPEKFLIGDVKTPINDLPVTIVTTPASISTNTTATESTGTATDVANTAPGQAPKYIRELETTFLKSRTLTRNKSKLLERRQAANAEKSSNVANKNEASPVVQSSVSPPIIYKQNLPPKKKELNTVSQQEAVASTNAEDAKYCLNIDREEAERILQTHGRDGMYLIRPSSQHQYALSVFVENRVVHFGIKLTENNRLEFVSVGEDREFNSLEEIVTYFHHRPILQMASTCEIIRLKSYMTNPKKCLQLVNANVNGIL